MVIKAFIFDMDGVITDTAEYHYRSWKQLADEENLPFTREDNEQLRSVSRRESLNRLLKGRSISEEQAHDWMTRKNTYFHQYLDRITPQDCLPGINRFLEEARAVGIKLAIASASKNVRPVLERLQLLNSFEVLGDGGCVVNNKPAPDLFLWAAGGLGVRVPEAVVFEDADAGIDAARNAGFWTVGLASAANSQAHLTFSTLEHVHVQDLLTHLEATPSGSI